MNVFAKFDEIPSMILQDIKETKRYGHTDGRSFGRSDNVKTVYPPTNKVCGGYNYVMHIYSWGQAVANVLRTFSPNPLLKKAIKYVCKTHN